MRLLVILNLTLTHVEDPALRIHIVVLLKRYHYNRSSDIQSESVSSLSLQHISEVH
jgi:hypothetical protein